VSKNLHLDQLPESSLERFVYIGNTLNTHMTISPLMSLGVDKSATAHMIQSTAAASAPRGFK
jgi:hypothetical protein